MTSPIFKNFEKEGNRRNLENLSLRTKWTKWKDGVNDGVNGRNFTKMDGQCTETNLEGDQFPDSESLAGSRPLIG